MVVKYPYEHLIDACIAQLNKGEDLEDVIARYPEQADELRPILAAVVWMRVDRPAPEPAARRMRDGKAALMAAAAERRREVEQTQGYINEIQAGVSFEELMTEAKPAMQSVIQAAWQMQHTPDPMPDPDRAQRNREALLSLAKEKQAERQRELSRAFTPAAHLQYAIKGLISGLNPGAYAIQRRLAQVVASAALVSGLVFGLSNVNEAAADSLPGDTTYNIKRLAENARLLFAFDPVKRAELDVVFDRERLDELLRLANDGRTVPAQSVGEWVSEQRNAFASVRRLPLEQQNSLGDALLSSLGSLTAAGDLLRQNADEAGVDGFIAFLSDRERARLAAIEALETPVASEDEVPVLELVLDRAPMPVDRPLPDEEVDTDEDDKASETELLAAPIEVLPIVEDPSEATEEPAGFVMPVLIAEDEDEDEEDEDRTTLANEPPDDPGVSEEPTDEPPAFVLPPIGEEPTEPPPGDDLSDPENPDPNVPEDPQP